MGFTSSSRERGSPTLPLAPMVDILFLLLVFFMTTSIMREQETAIDVSLEPTESGKVDSSKIPVNITVLADGTIYIGTTKYTIEELKSKLIEIGEALPDAPIVIRGDRASDLGVTMQILDLCKSKDVNLNNVSLGSVHKEEDL
jgi:biopolymer transport protein ExbD